MAVNYFSKLVYYKLLIIVSLTCLITQAWAQMHLQKSEVLISGKLDFLDDKYQLKIRLSSQAINPIEWDAKEFSVPIKNNFFSQRLKGINSVRVINISYHSNISSNFISLNEIFIEPKDSVVITSRDHKLYFSGRNAEKYNCQAKLYEQRLKMDELSDRLGEQPSPQVILKHFKSIDSIALVSFRVLNDYKRRISADMFILIKTDLISKIELSKLNQGFLYGSDFKDNRPYILAFKDYRDPIWNAKVKSEIENNSISIYSANYVWFSYLMNKFQNFFLSGLHYDPVRSFHHFSTEHVRGIRENLIYYALKIDIRDSGKNLNNLVDESIAKGYIRRKGYINELLKIRSSTLIGSDAYNFSLVDDKNALVQLSDFKGKIVLLDFWYTRCGPCAEVHPYLEKIRQHFIGQPFVLVGISIDKKREDWLNSIKAGIRTSDKNINLFTGGKETDDPIIKKYLVSGYPTLILIDGDGKLMQRPAHPGLDDCASIIAQIEAKMNKF